MECNYILNINYKSEEEGVTNLNIGFTNKEKGIEIYNNIIKNYLHKEQNVWEDYCEVFYIRLRNSLGDVRSHDVDVDDFLDIKGIKKMLGIK